MPRGTLVGKKQLLSHEDSLRVMEKLPHSQMRLLFALARWGGLRVPSEPRQLRWSDIDWERRTMRVTSPKTAHHRGHESRVVPIFPELAPLLDQRFSDAAEGEELVLPFMTRWADSTFASILERAVDAAGLERWPRLWHSLRATRQNELASTFEPHVACAWIGNSEVIANRHYLQVTDEHIAKAAQKAAQQSPATSRNESQQGRAATAETTSVQGVATTRD